MATTTAALEQAPPFSPIFRKVDTETEAPLFRNKHVDNDKKKKKKRFSMQKMMSKINKSSKRILAISKSTSSDSADTADAVEPTKLFLEAASATGAPRIEMVATTDDEISYSSSSEHAVTKSMTDSASPETSSINETVVVEESSTTTGVAAKEREPVVDEETKLDLPQDVKVTINYDMDDEEYVEEKELEKTPITSSDAMALFLAGALIAAQAFFV